MSKTANSGVFDLKKAWA